MTRLNIAEAREGFSELVNRASLAHERTIVSSHGKDVAAVIPIEDLRLLERLSREELDREDKADALEALKEAKEEGTVPLADLLKEVGA